jgi:hypothetical protein
MSEIKIQLSKGGWNITPERAKELYDKRIEWHDNPADRNPAWPNEASCAGRHGVVRGVGRNDVQEIAEMLVFYFGDRCYWTKSMSGLTDFEFVHQAKVYPPPRKPWGWCGVSVLFAQNQEWEARERTASLAFKPGQMVEFTAKGVVKRGLVSSINAKSISVTVIDEGTWRVAAQLLREYKP